MHHPRQDSTYHGLCYTSRGALAGMRNSPAGELQGLTVHILYGLFGGRDISNIFDWLIQFTVAYSCMVQMADTCWQEVFKKIYFLPPPCLQHTLHINTCIYWGLKRFSVQSICLSSESMYSRYYALMHSILNRGLDDM